MLFKKTGYAIIHFIVNSLRGNRIFWRYVLFLGEDVGLVPLIIAWGGKD